MAQASHSIPGRALSRHESRRPARTHLQGRRRPRTLSGNPWAGLRQNRHERRGADHYGEERFESEEARALSIVEQELGRRRWTAEELKHRRKGDKHKVVMAARLRRETTMTLKWIAEHLAMGSGNNVSNRLAAARKRND